MKNVKIIEGGITAPKGFKAAGGHVGIKKAKKDLCLVASDVPADFVGCFTTNTVKAAPVLWDMKIAEGKGKVRGFVVNSGNANACTGEEGVRNNKKIAEAFADCLEVWSSEILVCSTGVIGVQMPVDVITQGIYALSAQMDYGSESGLSAAEAIMTTDTFVKTIALEFSFNGKIVRMGGMAKGSGMIHPNMATMLSFVTTDASISRKLLDRALKDSITDTYNMISVDGDTSTNDTILVLANGAAGNETITSQNSDEYTLFKKALDYVNKKLAIQIVKDGEGATRVMAVKVIDAKTKDDARKIAKAVVSSSLFKAALFGADANWGRVLCAMGYSGGEFDPDCVTIVFKSYAEDEEYDEITLMQNGVPVKFDETLAKKILERKEVMVDIILKGGEYSAKAWGCDLTYDYVKINGDYRS